MNQKSQPPSHQGRPRSALLHSPAFLGASYMLLAGLLFAIVNVVTQYLTMTMGLASPSVAFGQYFVALLISLPWLCRHGFRAMKTNHPFRHILRVAFAALGVQAWVAGLAHVPIWQAIALIMTSPFFVTLGAHLFLQEQIGLHRLMATLLGFVGGMIILAPWSDAFTLHALWPVLAAVFWAATSLLTKTLTGKEAPETVTVYLLILLTPINFALAVGTGLVMPDLSGAGLIVASGILIMLAQLSIARAYASADAAYVQPYDHVKLVFNVLGGFLAFGFAPPGQLWLGASLIVGASLYILHREAILQK